MGEVYRARDTRLEASLPLRFCRLILRTFVVPVGAGSGFTYGKLQRLFDYAGYNAAYDVSSDGKRFLIVKNGVSGGAPAHPSVVVVTNWLDEVKARMPAQR
jgi:hypothetical protein